MNHGRESEYGNEGVDLDGGVVDVECSLYPYEQRFACLLVCLCFCFYLFVGAVVVIGVCVLVVITKNSFSPPFLTKETIEKRGIV